MSITVVTRWKGNQEEGLRLAREVAPLIKRQGATSVRFGHCHSGAYAGHMSVAAIYPDGATYGRAMQALAEDAQFQRILAEASKIGELQDRSVIITQDL